MSASAAPLLEIAANSVASALAAQDGGAGRVELCASLGEGGVTPSYATIALARERLLIPLYVLIRPRAGDFLYNALEIETMRRDIESCVRIGCDGVVIGALDADGNVALAACRELIGAAGGVGVTFHRAFDLARDAERALEDIVALGCERILTSGQRETAIEGAAQIRTLIGHAGQRIVVMPGAGVTADNVAALQKSTGAREVHASAKHALPSGMRYRPRHLTDMQAGEIRSEQAEVRRIVQMLGGAR
jgi:copper homeostasis protein